MADVGQLEIALRNADAAGDTAAAQMLAGEIMKMRKPIDPVAIAKDVGQSLDAGVARGVAGIGGMVGDVTDLGAKGIEAATNFVTDKLGMERSAPRDRSQSLLNKIPTSESLQKAIQKDFYNGAPEHQPQTTAGESARTIGEFAPGMIGGGIGIIRRAATQVAMPAVASEAAGQYTKGSDAEPYARIAAALGAGVAGATRSAPAKVGAADLKAAAKQSYEDPAVKGLVLEPSGPARLGSQVERAMEQGGARRDYAGAAFNRADELKDLPNTQVGRAMQAGGLNPGATVDDIKSVRTAMGEIVRGGTDPMTGALNPTANAAVTGRKKISEYLANLPAGDVRSGDAAAAGRLLTKADADYAASKRAGVVEALMRNAELNTGAANSGQNINNQQRQQLKILAKSAKKNAGLNDAEMAQLERAVMGTRIGNTARFVGNALAPSGAMALQNSAAAAALGGGAAYAFDKDPAVAAVASTIASQIIGRGARSIGNRSTAREVAKFQDMAVQRSPSYGAIKSANSAKAAQLTAEERRLAIARALMGAQVAPRMNAQQQ